MKILHILDHYKPHFSGYVFRTSYIVKHQEQFGINPVLLTSPKQGEVKTDCEEIDDLRVYRTVKTNFGTIPFIKELRLMKALMNRIDEVVRREKPDIIHAHSPSLNGISALAVARKLNVPLVYEVRAFWEDAAVDHGSFQEGSFRYRISRFIETALLKRADAIFTICDGLQTEMISRGMAREKITVVRNCVDTEFFFPQRYDEDLAAKHGLKGMLVFGFIGSFYNYEGLDILIDSFARAVQGNNNMKLLLVGGGPECDRLCRRAEGLGITKDVIFTGRVPHEQIRGYYTLMDVLVYPRKKMRLTDFVTPLKPLEAMAMGKGVIGSDVGGMKELISDGVDGFLFKAGDVDSLYRLMYEIMTNSRKLSEVSKAGQETIQKKHVWSSAVKGYLPVYNELFLMEGKRTKLSHQSDVISPE